MQRHALTVCLVLVALPTIVVAKPTPRPVASVLLVAPQAVAQRFESELRAVSAPVQRGAFAVNPKLSGLQSQGRRLGCTALVLVAADAEYAGVWPVGATSRMRQRTMLRGPGESVASLALRVAEYIDAWRPLALAPAPAGSGAMTIFNKRARSADAAKAVSAVQPGRATAPPTKRKPTAAKPKLKPVPDANKPVVAAKRSAVDAAKRVRAAASTLRTHIDLGGAFVRDAALGPAGFARLGASLAPSHGSPWTARGWVDAPVVEHAVDGEAGRAEIAPWMVAAGAFYRPVRAGKLGVFVGAGLAAGWTRVQGFGNDDTPDHDPDLVAVGGWIGGGARWQVTNRWSIRADVTALALNPEPVVVIGESRHRRAGAGYLRAALAVEFRL